MQYVIFDTETTGLGNNDEVIQFSCMYLNENFKLNGIDDFYCMPTAEISAGAMAVHHLTLNKVRKLSGQKFFEEKFYAIKEKFGKDCTFINYSSSMFDFRLVNQTLTRAGMPEFDFGAKTLALNDNAHGFYKYDLMSGIARLNGIRGGKIKLENALKLIFDYNEQDLKMKYFNLCKMLERKGLAASIETDMLFHNARFDTFCMWFLLNEFGGRLKAM